MSSALPDLLDHTISLMQGSITGITRAISAGKFKHVEGLIEYAYNMANGAPYPFDLLPESFGGDWPDGYQQTLSMDRSQHAATFVVRVGYQSRPHKVLELEKQIYNDVYEIIRSLSDPDSWGAVSSFENVVLGPWGVSLIVIPGDSDTTDIMYALEQPVTLVYSEDYS